MRWPRYSTELSLLALAALSLSTLVVIILYSPRIKLSWGHELQDIRVSERSNKIYSATHRNLAVFAIHKESQDHTGVHLECGLLSQHYLASIGGFDYHDTSQILIVGGPSYSDVDASERLGADTLRSRDLTPWLEIRDPTTLAVRKRTTLSQSSIERIRLSPNGRLAAVCGSGVSLVSVENLDEITKLEESEFAYSCAWSPDGTRLATGSTTGRVCIFTLTNSRPEATYKISNAPITSITFGLSEAQVIAGTLDFEGKVPLATAIFVDRNSNEKPTVVACKSDPIIGLFTQGNNVIGIDHGGDQFRFVMGEPGNYPKWKIANHTRLSRVGAHACWNAPDGHHVFLLTVKDIRRVLIR